MDKKEIRKLVKAKRNGLSAVARKIRSFRMQRAFLKSSLYRESDTLLLYSALGSEIQTENIIRKALKDEKKVFLPLTYMVNTVDSNGQNKSIVPCMDFHRIYSLAERKAGAYGILEPPKTNEMFRDFDYENTLILVPGVVFDKKGNRYGYGKGYYDHYLQDKHMKKIGACYELQLLDEIPCEPFDVRMDYIITEKKLWKI